MGSGFGNLGQRNEGFGVLWYELICRISGFGSQDCPPGVALELEGLLAENMGKVVFRKPLCFNTGE